MNWRGRPRIEAASAGSQPAGFVHEMTYQVLEELGLRPAGLVSKSWKDLREQDFDAVITLCGYARDAICPQWPAPTEGKLPVWVHWGFEDPTANWLLPDGPRLAEFRGVRDEILECVERLAAAPDGVLQDDARFAELVGRIAADAPNPGE